MHTLLENFEKDTKTENLNELKKTLEEHSLLATVPSKAFDVEIKCRVVD